MYRRQRAAQNQIGRITGRRPLSLAACFAAMPKDPRRGLTLRPRTWRFPKRLRHRCDDESGAEMVEFAFVVVLLIALLYGIISYGLILSAQATVTQAAADGARAGLVSTTTAQATAEAQAANDLSWMDKGQCYEPHST